MIVGDSQFVELAAGSAESWPGVDEVVVNRVAAEAGRSPWKSPLAPSGDLLLFLFLLAGLAGGFVLGHGWRSLFHAGRGRRRRSGGRRDG